jgi:hypothetical protein
VVKSINGTIMTRQFKFYKEDTGRWYVDLPEWEGVQADLEMVAGADMFLEILAQGEDVVHVTLSDEEIEGSEKLEFKYPGTLEGWELGEGAWYKLVSYMGLDYQLDMWLCDVTKFVFGSFPKVIYYYKNY